MCGEVDGNAPGGVCIGVGVAVSVGQSVGQSVGVGVAVEEEGVERDGPQHQARGQDTTTEQVHMFAIGIGHEHLSTRVELQQLKYG